MHPGGLDGDPDLILTGLGIRELLENQGFDRTELVLANRVHGPQ